MINSNKTCCKAEIKETECCISEIKEIEVAQTDSCCSAIETEKETICC